MTSEIITLQFGPTACFVGAHYWNLQEAAFRYAGDNNEASSSASATSPEADAEADHDALFRAGEDARGRATYTPRLVLCDRRRPAAVTVDVDADDADPDADVADKVASAVAAAVAASGGRRVELHAQPGEPRSRFQRDAFEVNGNGSSVGDVADYAESGFQTWTDCLGTRLHPRSLLWLQELRPAADDAEEFESRLRLFAEECDRLQGFQTLADAHDARFGLGACVPALAHLAEEFPKKASLAFPCFAEPAWLPSLPSPSPSTSPSVSAAYRLSSLLSLVRLDSLAGLLTPLSSSTSPWSTSSPSPSPSQYVATGAMAAWLDTVTLPMRLRAGGHASAADAPDLWDLQRLLAHSGRRICCPALRLIWPRPASEAAPLPDLPERLGPFCGAGARGDTSCCSLASLSIGRGLPCPQEVVERWLADVRAPGAGPLARHVHLAGPAVPTKPPLPARQLVGESAAGDVGSGRRGLAAWALLENLSTTAGGPAAGMEQLADAGDFLLRSGFVGGGGGGGFDQLRVESDDVREAVAAARDIADRYRPDRGV